MNRSMIELLVDPIHKQPLHVEGEPGPTHLMEEGTLRAEGGHGYPIVKGIPRFITTHDASQEQTQTSFGYKWKRRETYDSPAVHTFYRKWLLERYGFESPEQMCEHACQGGRILDAGCGSGFSSGMWLSENWQGGNANVEWYGVDISEAIDVARERLGHLPGTHFLQADILQLPFVGPSFGVIFSEGVLHHTPSTERALKELSSLLIPGGEMWFYVYRKKGPIREFSDDYIREIVSAFDSQTAWNMLLPLTKLGQALARLKVEVDVPDDIPWLGIQAGTQDIQRLMYWNFAKLFWNEELSFDENHHVNFDWYHPRYAHRQTEEEVRRWCDEAGLHIHHLSEQPSGFTVRARKSK